MVSSSTIIAMVIRVIVSIMLPIAVFIYFRKKEKLNFKPVFIGAIIFFVFVYILEASLHKVVIGNNLIDNQPILFAIYGALAAGIFEEVGRFFAFKTILKKNHEWKDGISYGIGHGGIEAILVGGITAIYSILCSCLINNGSFDSVLASNAPVSQIEQLNNIKDALIQSTPFENLMGGVERIFALGIQLALTMVVLYAIRYRKNIFLFVAILLHAVVDFPAGLYQSGMLTNIVALEIIVAIEFVISIVFLTKTKRVLSKEEKVLEVRSKK